MTAPATSDSLIGFTLVNKYKVLRQIGRGGMGVVYEAEHVELGKRVAIKLMLEKYAEDGEATARFKREALAASRIGNPHIIDVSDIGVAPDGRSFVVMELLVGSSLSDVIEKGGAMAPWRALQIMRQVLRAVGAAHAKSIVHRDLKPDNIFLVNQDDHHDFVKLLDFGISKYVDQAAEIAATKLTTTGMVMGTPLYMAPEQAMGATTDHHADIYALGVILYEMLGGQPPFNGATYPILVAKLLTQDPPLLSELRPGLPPALVAAVHRALEKEPEKRFHSCEQFAAALPKDTSQSGSMEMAKTLDSGNLASAGTLGISASGARVQASGPRTAQPASKLGVSTLGSSVSSQQVLPQQRRSKLPILFGALGVGLAVGAIAIVALSRGDKADNQITAVPITEPAKAVAPPPPNPGSDTLVPRPGTPTGHIHVKTTPAGGTVTIDGTKIGVAPIEMTVAAGTHQVHVELDGYKPMDQDVDVTEKHDVDTNILMPKAPTLAPPPPPKVVKTIHPQDKGHVEPTPPGMAPPPQTAPQAPPPQQSTSAVPGANPYEDTAPKKQPPAPPKQPGGAAAKPNPYQ